MRQASACSKCANNMPATLLQHRHIWYILHQLRLTSTNCTMMPTAASIAANELTRPASILRCVSLAHIAPCVLRRSVAVSTTRSCAHACMHINRDAETQRKKQFISGVIIPFRLSETTEPSCFFFFTFFSLFFLYVFFLLSVWLVFTFWCTIYCPLSNV